MQFESIIRLQIVRCAGLSDVLLGKTALNLHKRAKAKHEQSKCNFHIALRTASYGFTLARALRYLIPSSAPQISINAINTARTDPIASRRH